MTLFYKQYKSIQPYYKTTTLRRKARTIVLSFFPLCCKTLSAGESIQSQEGRLKLDGMYECIHCMLFYILPVLLVEPGWMFGSCDVNAGL